MRATRQKHWRGGLQAEMKDPKTHHNYMQDSLLDAQKWGHSEDTKTVL
jgi:hypothetical protein